MTERNAPRAYGVRVGLVAGVFAVGQAVLMAAAAHGAQPSVLALQQVWNSPLGTVDPLLLLPALAPMFIVTYGSMLLVGALTVWFAREAGRLSAVAQGRRAGGASAGMWTWLVSTALWLVAAVVCTVITNGDGTVSGAFTGTFTPRLLPQQLLFLLAQLVVAALVGLGFCAMFGSMGARNAELIEPVAPPMPTGFPGGPYPFGRPGQPGAWYGPAGASPYYPPYPPTSAYPPAPWGPVPAYPPFPPAQQRAPGPYGPPPPYGQPPSPSPWALSLGSPLPSSSGAAGHAVYQFSLPRPATLGPIPYPPPPSFYVPEPSKRTPASSDEPPAASAQGMPEPAAQ